MSPTFTQGIANIQCPINKNIAFIGKGISWAIVVYIDRLYVTANVFMNVRTCFYWNEMTVASVICPPVLKDYLGKRIKSSKYVEHDCALQDVWAPFDPRETCGCRPLFFADGTVHFEDIKVCINGFSQFLYVLSEVRLFSLLLSERFALGLGLWRLGRRSSAQHLAAEDGRNGNCGFPTLRNVNLEI